MYDRQQILERTLDLPSYFTVIIGCGGVGYNVALNLAMAGVSKFILVDQDRLSETNLTRIPLPPDTVGQFKVECLQKHIHSLRPEAEVVIYPTFGDLELLNHLWSQYILSVVVNCADRFNCYVPCYEWCREHEIRFVRGGSEEALVSVCTEMGMMLDLDPEHDGYAIVPSFVGATAISAALCTYLVLYPELQVKPLVVDIFKLLEGSI